MSGNELTKKEQARERRRRRRKQEQRLYTFIVIFIILLIACGIFIAYSLISGHNPFASLLGSATGHSEVLTQTVAEDGGVSTREQEILNEMTIQEKVSALFLLTFDQLSGEEDSKKFTKVSKRGLDAYSVSAIMFDSGNVESKKQVVSMLEDARKASKYPLLMFFEENGGTQNVMATAMEDTAPISPALIGAEGDPTKAYAAGQKIGAYLYAAGFDVNVAPIANITGSEDSFIYSADPQTAFEMSTSMLNGLKEVGMLTCVGRFPYLTEEDPGGMAGITTTNVSLNELRDKFFVPFNGCISAGTELLMMSSIQLPRALSASTPATLSDTLITDILRGELGYTGVIVSAPLNQRNVKSGYTPDNAAVTAILAGVDLLYMPEDFETAYQGILTAISKGIITEDRINESILRILKLSCR